MSGFSDPPLCKTNVFVGSALNDPRCPTSNFFGTCFNFGHCFNESCCCPSGFTGVTCNSEILECLSNPCQNGGFCNEFENYYNCSCVDG